MPADFSGGQADSVLPGESDETIHVQGGHESNDIHIGRRPRFSPDARRKPANNYIPDSTCIKEPENPPKIRLESQSSIRYETPGRHMRRGSSMGGPGKPAKRFHLANGLHHR